MASPMQMAEWVHSTIIAAAGDCITGVSIVDSRDKDTWRIEFKDSATPGQRTSAQAVMVALDYAEYVQGFTTRANEIKANAGRMQMLDKLRNASNAQIDTWIDANVTSLAQAREVLKAILKILSDMV